MKYQFTEDFARSMDERDPFSAYRKKFFFPQQEDGSEVLYFTGNSLGLQPKGAEEAVLEEMENWRKLAVDGHFSAKHPWFSYHEELSEPTGRLTGAKPEEVVVMNSLTVNLHLLMVSFYRPDQKRFKILCEDKAFPSDRYAIESQVRYHGFDPDTSIVTVAPRAGEHIIRTDDLLARINDTGEELALVLMGGVNFYTGQAFDMRAITEAAHQVGAYAGFDLAHAAGNLNMKLHEWEVDFAVWCSYKYLNSGPGSVGGAFVHEKYAGDPAIPRFAGWWGHQKDSRFRLDNHFDPIPTAESWQLSNAPIFSMAVHRVALDIFDEARIGELSRKRDLLTGYLAFVINTIAERYPNVGMEIITPSDQSQRGAQLSILMEGKAERVQEKLIEQGVSADLRKPDVLRLAPAPLYNSFQDVQRFGEVLEKALSEL